ncbi:MAG: molybdopterin-dependent oxidoreductase [Anaerolineae bacterium]|nr:molybdopterin-dependent oxidoreductase [Anaerolineae bacterium]
MNKIVRVSLLLVCALLITACGGGAQTPPAPDATILTITGGESEHTYTLAQLQALDAVDVESDDGAFVGVRLSDLLADAGFAVATIASVRVAAIDGFSSTYQADRFTREDAVLAYARADGDLTGEELPLRMVMPGEEGVMQPRMVTRIEVTLQ